MSNLITNLINADDSYIYDVEFTHPDYSPAFYKVFGQTSLEATWNDILNTAYIAELAWGIWEKYNLSGFYHTMKITLKQHYDDKAYDVVIFEGGRYELQELAEKADAEASAEEEEEWEEVDLYEEYRQNTHCDTYGVCGGTFCPNYWKCNGK